MKIDVSIEGLPPGLLMNRFAESSSEEAEVEQSAYKNEEGKLYQPAEHILRAMAIAASTFRPEGKGRANYAKVFGNGLVQIEPPEIVHKNQGWVVDSRPVKVKGSRKKVLRRRVRLPTWELDFTIVSGDSLSPETIKNVLEHAGYYVGIGDFRPQRKGPFGRFKITKFEAAQ